MKIAHIVPRKHLDLADMGDFDFVLAHIALKSKKYLNFYKDRGDREIYLDNGVWETGRPVNVRTMIELAIELKPTYIYATDYINDAARTIAATGTFCRAAARCAEFDSKIIATAQGRSRDVWYSCIQQLAQVDGVDMIALPRHTKYDMYEYERNVALRMTKTRLDICRLIDTDQEGFNGKLFYATGTGASICVRELRAYPWIIGIDTTMACLLASQRIRISGRFENYKPDEKLDFSAKFDQEQLDAAVFNIGVLNNWAHGED